MSTKDELMAEKKNNSRGSLSLSTRDWESLSTMLRDQLEKRYLLPYMSRSRWFRQKSLLSRRVLLDDYFPFGSDTLRSWLLLVTVEFSNDHRETYSVPIAFARSEESALIRAETPAAVVAEVDAASGGGVLYDAVYSGSFRDAMFATLATENRAKGHSGSLIIDQNDRWKARAEAFLDEPRSKVLRTEQSNSSILYRDEYFLKVFRTIEVGVNPDVELGKYLSETCHFPNVPAYAADLQYEYASGERASIGICIEFVANQGTAMSFANGMIDRFFEGVVSGPAAGSPPPAFPESLFDVRASGVPESFVGLADGFFLEMVELLGQRTGELHLKLGMPSEDEAYGSEPFSRLYRRSLYESLCSLLERVLAGAQKVRRSVSSEEANLLERFFASEERLLSRFGAIDEKEIDVHKIRIHGDYHLEQVLFTGRDFVIIDFEGEPARSLSERRLKFSAFRDVAGMIRSFHYAIHGRYLQVADLRPADAEALAAWIRPWYVYVSGIFLEGYLKAVDGALFVPSNRESLETLLDVFLLEKAVYEVGYEMNNRPDWVRIPLDGISFVLGETDRGAHR